ncbi:MAG: phosphonate C-P lyase system protein PhnG [Bacteroidota bacterium]
MDTDYILVEGDLNRIKEFTAASEQQFTIKVTKPPTIALTMIRAQDSVEAQEFYLGEALMTEAEVVIDGITGIGLCLGDEPQRAYCMAVVDALLQGSSAFKQEIEQFLKEEEAAILRQEQQEQAQILRTQVDFKLMKQS